MSARQLEFFYRGMPVGIFREPVFPDAPGRYRYEPYRGPGHYELGQALRRGERCECTYEAVDPIVRFAVIATQIYGQIDLYDFQRREDP